MAKKWTKSWMHEQNCCFANLNLLLFWPSHCRRLWFAAILSCSHSVYFIPFSSPLHFHFLLWKVLLHALHWAQGSVAQIASHAWEHYLTYSLCTDTPSPQKNSGKELDVCVPLTLIVSHRCLSPLHFFFRGGGICMQGTWSRAWFMFSDENTRKSQASNLHMQLFYFLSTLYIKDIL